MRLRFCNNIRNLVSKFVLLCYQWISCQNKYSPEIQQLSCQHQQSNLPATLHWIIQPLEMLDISNVASDSVSFYQVLSPDLPWFVLIFLVKSRWERSLDRTKVPRSLTYMMQLSWNSSLPNRKHSRVILHGSRVVTERENRTWSWRSVCGVAVIDLDYANLQEENCRRIDEYRFTYFIYKHMKIWDQARVWLWEKCIYVWIMLILC